LDLFGGNRTDECRPRGKLFFGKPEWRAGFFGETIDIDAANALHARVGRVALRRRPIEDYFIALLRAGKQFGALLHAFDGRQGRPPFTAAERGKANDNHEKCQKILR
jgi:hypothetical protein